LQRAGEHHAYGGGQEKRWDGGHLRGDARDHDDKRDKRERSDVEVGGQSRGDGGGLIGRGGRICGGIKRETLSHQAVRNNAGGAYGQARHKEATAEREYVAVGHGGGKVGAIDQRRYNLAHVGAGDDGAGSHAERDVERGGDADERDADGPGCAPRSQHDAHGERRCKRDGQEQLRRDDLQAEIDHRRHGSRCDPRAHEHADAHQDEHGFQRVIDAVERAFEDVVPRIAQYRGDAAGQNAACYQRDLRLGL
jgi:hypothetical protein